MAQEGSFQQGAAILQTIRDRAGYERGLRPGRLARVRLVVGFAVLIVGLASCAVGMIGLAPVHRELWSPEFIALVSIGLIGAIVGVALIVYSFAPASLHRVSHLIETLSHIASFAAGLAGLMLSTIAVAVILYGIVSTPDAISEQTLANLLVAFLLCGELALLTIIDLKPILSSDGRSGAKSAVLRMQISSIILAGSVTTAIMLISTNASVGNFLPSALALTAGGAILRWSMVYRRRVDAAQREIAERLTDLVIVGRSPKSTTALSEALMRLENTISPASEQGRLGAVMRADSDVRNLVGYLIERGYSRHASFGTDRRFGFLQEIPDEELHLVAASVADTLRWNLLDPSGHRLTTLTSPPALTGQSAYVTS
ncbi:hypothetical protein [Ruania albidiflava]|uniref:hypothetical protein n=1 Tax=Ruania albidiflava TaxID=366586 RepID=UPI0003B4282A|nr:hypothetical protein [Ruania albidiflava]